METILTSEQKTEYISMKDNFQKKRDEINKEIGCHKVDFEKAKQKISNLEKEVENLRPMIKDCDKHITCKKCDIYSMKHLGSTPNPEKYHVYECIICGHEERYT